MEVEFWWGGLVDGVQTHFHVKPTHSAPNMVRICGKSPNSDFFDQTGPKKVRI